MFSDFGLRSLLLPDNFQHILRVMNTNIEGTRKVCIFQGFVLTSLDYVRSYGDQGMWSPICQCLLQEGWNWSAQACWRAGDNIHLLIPDDISFLFGDENEPMIFIIWFFSVRGCFWRTVPLRFLCVALDLVSNHVSFPFGAHSNYRLMMRYFSIFIMV